MTKILYVVKDSLGETLRVFNNYEGAVTFIGPNNSTWKIKRVVKETYRKPTNKMVNSVSFIENILNIPFEGDINCFEDVQTFLDWHLEDAKKENKVVYHYNN